MSYTDLLRATEIFGKLSDDELQEQYRQAYAEQIRRQSCPACGETGVF